MHRRLRSWLLPLAASIGLLISLPAAAASAPRLALVVGNAAYPARPLATTADDAALVAQALAQAGFDVTAAHDLDHADVRAALDAFLDSAREAGPDATILVYLAGYGVQYDGDNYLVPIDARLDHDDDVPRETADLDDFARVLAAVPAKTRILVYDLARTDPFATADEMPLAAGLALRPAPKDTLVAFNAAPGMVALPAALPYGAYARALAEMIGTPGLAPNTLFDRVRLRVGELTDGAEVPWDTGTVDATPLLPATGADQPQTTAKSIDAIPVDALSPDIAYSAVVARDSLAGYVGFVRSFSDGPLSTRVRTLLAVRREALIWQAALQAEDPRAAWTYMRRYPRGPHRFDARRRLAALHASLEPPPRFDIVAFPDLPPPSANELRLLEAPLEAIRGLPSIPPPPSELLQPADGAYYDGLPPPIPAPTALLPIAAPLPRAAAPLDDGQIAQMRPGKGAAVTQTLFGSDGDATLTLVDANDAIAKVAARTTKDGGRTIVETDAKNALLSRTTVARTADGSRIVQTDASGGILCTIGTRTAPEGARVTRVTNGREKVLAAWRQDPEGIVVAREVEGVPLATASRRPTAQVPDFLAPDILAHSVLTPPAAMPTRSQASAAPSPMQPPRLPTPPPATAAPRPMPVAAPAASPKPPAPEPVSPVAAASPSTTAPSSGGTSDAPLPRPATEPHAAEGAAQIAPPLPPRRPQLARKAAPANHAKARRPAPHAAKEKSPAAHRKSRRR